MPKAFGAQLRETGKFRAPCDQAQPENPVRERPAQMAVRRQAVMQRLMAMRLKKPPCLVPTRSSAETRCCRSGDYLRYLILVDY